MVTIRIPYTGPLPLPRIVPPQANTLRGSVEALVKFLTSGQGGTALLTGAGISVASGLNDYRGPTGTYKVNKSYRPIYYGEFTSSHEFRKRYWARGFLGWPNLERSKPNAAHRAVKGLGDLGLLTTVITQNVDSLHPIAHPNLPTVELHGYLRSAICLSCSSEYPRNLLQADAARLNPSWAELLSQLLASGALTTDDRSIQATRGLRTNPDGDVDLPGLSYSSFRYPACPTCLTSPPKGARVDVDDDGAWLPGSTAGVLKPAVVMFGEAISMKARDDAYRAVDQASRLLVVGTSLATYSAWRLVTQASEAGKRIGIVNLGGVRGEESLVTEQAEDKGSVEVRINMDIQEVLPALAKELER